jgi:hypothetical protein
MMSMEKVKVQLPDGTYKTGEPVGITDQKEPWAEYYLEDGSVLRLRQVVISVVKLDEKDAQSNPVYAFNGIPVLFAMPGEMIDA